MEYTKWLKWVILIGLCLVPFVMFIVADGVHFPLNMFFPYITGKNFVFRILVEFLLLCYLLLALREPKYRPRASLIMWAVCLFVAWMAIATVFSADPVKSFWSNFERMDGYITQLHLLALFIIAGAVLTAERWWERFFQVAVAASVLQGIYALFQAFHVFGLAPSSQSGARADTTFGNATYLAVYMLMMFFITLFLLIRERKSKWAWGWYGAAMLLQLLGLYFTETRGAILGVIGGLIVAALYIALLAKDTHWQRLRTYCLWGLGVMVLLAILFFALKNTSFVQHNDTLSRFATISLNDPEDAARLVIWGEAWKGFVQSPKTVLLGWGQENFNFVFNRYYNPSMYNQEQWFDRAHNMFIDWTIAGGIPVLLLYVFLFALAGWALYKSELELPEQAVLIGLLLAYAFNNLFVFDNLISYIYFIFILAFAHGLSKREPPGFFWMSKPLSTQGMAVAAPVLLVLLGWMGWYLNGPGIARAQTLIPAISTQNLQTGQPEDPSQNIAYFQQALSEGGVTLGFQETVEQLFQFVSNNIAPSSSVSPALKQQAYTLTVGAANTLLTQRPHDARLELFDGVFYDSYGQYQQGLNALQAALNDSPGKQQILFEIASTYLAANDYKDAVAPAAQAFNEAPAYSDARVLYAAVLYYNGENAQADQLLQQGFGTTTVNDDGLLQAFFATKQWSRASAIYALRLSENPSDVQSAVGYVVTTYFANGNKPQAVAGLQKAAAEFPQYAGQIQSFVSQIQNGTLTP